MARPIGSQNKDKPFREALRLEIAALGDDDPKSLRRLARKLLETASGDEGLQAIREVADRLDGKPAQAIANDDDAFQVILQPLVRKIVDPRDGADS